MWSCFRHGERWVNNQGNLTEKRNDEWQYDYFTMTSQFQRPLKFRLQLLKHG